LALAASCGKWRKWKANGSRRYRSGRENPLLSLAQETGFKYEIKILRGISDTPKIPPKKKKEKKKKKFGFSV